MVVRSVKEWGRLSSRGSDVRAVVPSGSSTMLQGPGSVVRG